MFDNLSRRQIIKTAGGFVAGAASAGSVQLISNLITGSTLVEPAHAQARPPSSCDGFVQDNAIPATQPGINTRKLQFICKGHITSDKHRFLNGVTRGGDVGLLDTECLVLSF